MNECINECDRGKRDLNLRMYRGVGVLFVCVCVCVEVSSYVSIYVKIKVWVCTVNIDLIF